MNGRLSGFLLAACLSAMACGEVVASSDDDGDDDGGSSQGDAGPETDAGAGGGPSASRGLVRAFSGNFTDQTGLPVQNGSLEALFGDYETATCDIDLIVGNCSALTCTPRERPGSPPDAGTIEFFIDNARLTEMTPSQDGSYPPFEPAESELFPAGSALAVSAVGAAVPAFNIDIVAPTPILFDTDVPSSGFSFQISMSADYGLRWAPSSAPADRVLVALTTVPTTENDVRRVLDCRVQSSAGDLVMPAALLSSLPAGPFDFEARVESQETVLAGDYDVTLAGAVVARGSSGDWARGRIDLVP